MVNPDGVIVGNYRTGIAGRDLNRQFRNTDKLLYPTVFNVKKVMSETKEVLNTPIIDLRLLRFSWPFS